MKKKSLYLFLLLFCSFFLIDANAQCQYKEPLMQTHEPLSSECYELCITEKAQQNIMELKKEYFRKNLTLTEKEAARFWPLFDQYLENEKKIHRSCKKAQEEKGIKRENGKIDFSSLTDEQIRFFYENKFDVREKLLTTDKEFYNNMSSILQAKNIVKYYQIEKSFKSELSKSHHKTK